MIGISLFPPTMTRTSGLTVAPGRCVHEVIAEAFGYERQQEVQRVLFGDTDVLGKALRITASRWLAWRRCSLQMLP